MLKNGSSGSRGKALFRIAQAKRCGAREQPIAGLEAFYLSAKNMQWNSFLRTRHATNTKNVQRKQIIPPPRRYAQDGAGYHLHL